METVNPGEIPFREQIGLGLQPVLHIVSGQRTLVHITEVRPPGDLVRRRHKVNFPLVYLRSRSWRQCTGWPWVLVMGRFIVFHIGYY